MDDFGKIDALRTHFIAALGAPGMRLSDFGVLSDDVDVLYELVNDCYWELKRARILQTESDGHSGNSDPLHY